MPNLICFVKEKPLTLCAEIGLALLEKYCGQTYQPHEKISLGQAVIEVLLTIKG